MSTLGPVDHISRAALPWRPGPELTECGKPIAELAGRVVTRDVIAARIRAVGQKRAAYETCMTCATTSDRWLRNSARHGGTNDAALLALAREINAIEHAYPPVPPVRGSDDQRYIARAEAARDLWERRQRLLAEIEAVGALIEAHRGEFDGYLAGLQDTVRLADRRPRRTRGAS